MRRLIYIKEDASAVIRSGIKNYFVNLKFYFVPIGAFAVGVIIGLSVLLPGLISVFENFAERVTEILEETSIDFTVVKDFVVNSVKELDWDNPLSSIGILISREWLESLFNGCLDLVASDLQPYADQLNAAVNTAVFNIKSLIAVFIIFAISGLIGGYFLTAYLVRRNTAKRKLRKYIFAIMTDSIIAPVILFVCIWLYALWKPSLLFSSFVSLAVFCVVALLSARLLQGDKTVTFKEIFKPVNVFRLLASDFIIYYISVIIVIILSLVINIFSGLLVGFSFVEIAFLVISINAESYVKSLVPVKAEKEKEQLAA